MNRYKQTTSGLALAVGLTALAGCSGNTALVGRDSLPARASASQPVRNEIVGTVQRVDTGSSEIHLRASPGHPGMVTYSAETRVMHLGRAYPVSHLRSGDIVSMQMEKPDSRGNPHTHRISVQESSGDWTQRQN
jgi:hypothetical protein